MKSAEIKIESLPEGLSSIKDIPSLKDGADVVMYSGDISPGIDKRIMNYIYDTQENDTNLCFILCTFGGDADSAYLIARKLERLYPNFCILINGYCKSAGTLLALGANKLIVTPEAEFGPLDVQMFRPDEFMKRSSGLTITQATEWINEQAFDAFEDIFLKLRQRSGGNITTKTAGDIASDIIGSLYSKITDKIDPTVIGEMKRAIDVTVQYGKRLGVPDDLIHHMVKGYPSHSFVVDFDEAQVIFPNCRLIIQEEAMLLLEIQRILHCEFGSDLTSIPSEDGFLARISLELEDREVDPNEECESEDTEISVKSTDSSQEPSDAEAQSEIPDNALEKGLTKGFKSTPLRVAIEP